MFRGETFFDAAVRKITEETGCDHSKVKPVSVIQTWNTFFPDSNWDADRKPGCEGTQTVNIVVLCLYSDDDLELKKSAKDEWAVTDYRWVSPKEALVPGAFDKYVRINVEIAKKQGLF
jgi:8-oxo-dGTP pyrophosphatase MutT (NUDIX family)